MSVTHRSESKKIKEWAHLETLNNFYNISLRDSTQGCLLFIKSGLNSESPGDLSVLNFPDEKTANLYMKDQLKEMLIEGFEIKQCSDVFNIDLSENGISPKELIKYSSHYKHKTPRIFVNN